MRLRKPLLKEEASSLKVLLSHLDTYDFVALNISRVKTKPKEKGIKIYATQKQKESELQSQKEREERELKITATSKQDSTPKVVDTSKSTSITGNVEPIESAIDGDMEPLF